jgi:hypothetical protein
VYPLYLLCTRLLEAALLPNDQSRAQLHKTTVAHSTNTRQHTVTPSTPWECGCASLPRERYGDTAVARENARMHTLGNISNALPTPLPLPTSHAAPRCVRCGACFARARIHFVHCVCDEGMVTLLVRHCTDRATMASDVCVSATFAPLRSASLRASVVSVSGVFPYVLLLTHDNALPALAETWLPGRRWLSGG